MSRSGFGTLIAGATAAVLGFVALMFLWNRLETVPRAVPVIHWLALVIALCGARIAYVGLVALLSRPAKPPPNSDWEPVLLVGGEDPARLWLRGCCRWPRSGMAAGRHSRRPVDRRSHDLQRADPGRPGRL